MIVSMSCDDIHMKAMLNERSIRDLNICQR